MTMAEVTTDVVIVGGGLTGLTLAHLLTKLSIDFVLVEGRERLGGRVHTVTVEGGARVEMGATWYFPFFNRLLALLKEMDIELVPQYSQGKVVYEDRTGRINTDMEEEEGDMFRIKGGTGVIIDRLYEGLDPSSVLLGQVVNHVRTDVDGVAVETEAGVVVRGRRVVTTVPPQLLARSVRFSPPLPEAVTSVARSTHTWMGEAAKCAVSYATPFWRKSGKSGALYSGKGPVVQMYDQSDNTGEERFAVVGFLAGWVGQLSREERRRRVVDQLERLFGEKAADYLDYRDTVWQEEEMTMPGPGEADRLTSHRNNGHEVYQKTYFGDKLYIGGTETSTTSPGYMEGAVNSARRLCQRLAS